MFIHYQNIYTRHGYSTMNLDPAYLAMIFGEASRTLGDAVTVDARAMLCGL